MIVHLDLTSGASGDKLVASLLDLAEQLGLYSLARLNADLAAFEPRLRVSRERVVNGGIAAWHVKMVDTRTGRAADAPAGDGGVEAAGENGGGRGQTHAHTHWADVRARLEGSALPAGARKLALAVFDHVAAAEADVHGVAVERVAFHEVGALDSIGDIVSCALAVDALKAAGPLRITATPISLGGGVVTAAHGTLPVPAPATALIVKGLPVQAGPASTELTTPTGAAVVAELASGYGPLPPMVELACGRGAGSKRIEGVPNVLMSFAGRPLEADLADLPAAPGAHEAASAGGAATAAATRPAWPANAGRLEREGLAVEGVVLLDCNIDHISGEACAGACQRLLDAGALDVWQEPIAMKKGRLGVNLNVLAAPTDADRLAEMTHRLTGTLGLRRRYVQRTVAARSSDTVRTTQGLVRFKSMLAGDPDGADEPARLWVRAEADDVARLAAESGTSFSQTASKLGEEGARALGGVAGPGEVEPADAGAKDAGRADGRADGSGAGPR